MTNRVMIIVTTPPENADDVLDAVAQAGGGTIGNYTHCGFMVNGTGRFKPGDEATPHTGEKGQINSEPEVRIETFCEQKDASRVVRAIRQAHPYEEPVIYVVPLIAEEEL